MADWRSKDFDPFADNQTASGDWRSKDFDPFAEESASPPVAPVAPVASAPVAFSDRLREGVRSVVRNSRPYVEGAGMALGGVLAAPAAIASGPFAPATEAAGVAGGMLIGRQAQNLLEQYAGVSPPPQNVLADIIRKDAPEAVETGLAGPIIGKGLSGAANLVGKVAKPFLGWLGGTGAGAVDTAVESGKNITGPIWKRPQTDFAKAARGDIPEEEVVNAARSGLTRLLENRSAAYVADMEALPQSTKIPKKDVSRRLRELLKSYRVRTTPDGDIDFSHSPLSPKGAKEVSGIVELVNRWGNKQTAISEVQDKIFGLTKELENISRPEERIAMQGMINKLQSQARKIKKDQAFERTVLGMDTLKRKLDNYYSDSSDARQFVAALRDKVKRDIVAEVPQYGEMTKKYAQASQLIQDIRKATGISSKDMNGRTAANNTLLRLTSIMQKDRDLRRELLSSLSSQGGANLQELIAGASMNHYMPGSKLVTLTEGYAVLRHLDPSVAALVLASSPKVQAAFLQQFGRALYEFGPATSKTLGYAAAAGAVSMVGQKKFSEMTDEEFLAQ